MTEKTRALKNGKKCFYLILNKKIIEGKPKLAPCSEVYDLVLDFSLEYKLIEIEISTIFYSLRIDCL